MTQFVRIAALNVTAVALCGIALAGCAHGKPEVEWGKITAVETSTAPVSREDAYYQSAISAISRREYVLALDLLQAARLAKPSDVRVINAFGVVYDKLGRFDLSARYYTQAEALDPKSPIVQANQAYSATLRGQAAPARAASAVLAAAPPAPGAKPQAILALTPPPQPTLVRSTPRLAFTTAAPLYILDGSGMSRRGEPVRTALAKRGWSAPRWALRPAPLQAHTTIYFPAGRTTVAKALAATLPGSARLSACACRGLRLVLGSDSARWRVPLGKPTGKAWIGA